jgi:hypothetical protein
MWTVDRMSAPDGRERLGQLLRHAFPLGNSGSFTGVLDAIGEVGAAELPSGADKAAGDMEADAASI